MSDLLAIGKSIKMPCMRRGLCAYPNETIMVDQNALASMASSAAGIPVVIEHPDRPITNETIPEIEVVGRVSSFDYDPESDLWFANFVVDRQEGVDLLTNGYGVSTAWYGDNYGQGGTHNNVPFDRALMAGRYEHLAIVKNPRYEMARDPIFLNSNTCVGDAKSDTIVVDTVKKNESSSNRGHNMIGKIFRKLVTREEIKTNEGDELVIELEGAEMPLSKITEELLALRGKKQQEATGPAKKLLNGEDEIEVEGKKMTVNEMVAEYSELKKAAKPADEKAPEEKKEEAPKENDDAPKDEEKKEEEPKENESKDEEKKEEEEKAKTNSRFNSLKQTHENGLPVNQTSGEWLSTHERVLLGKQKYGSK